MEISLTKTEKEIQEKFYQLHSFASLADILEISPEYLHFVLHQMGPRYTYFEIPKKRGGTRKISNPHIKIKIVQWKLKQVLECVYKPSDPVMGFSFERSVVTNARSHRSGRGKLTYVLNVDLKDFFPSIHHGRVRGLFKAWPYKLPHDVADFIARICLDPNPEVNGLPQGAPTSPIISNMICASMDKDMQRLARRKRCFYTRYCDDITFSTSMSNFPKALARLEGNELLIGDELRLLIEEKHGFKINRSKLRLLGRGQRQEITGITVNEFPNVPQKYIREIRAMLHDWAANGYEAAQQKHWSIRTKSKLPSKNLPSFREVILGKVNYLGMVRGKDDHIYRKFMLRLVELDPTVRFEDTMHTAEEPKKIFLSYAREDEEKVSELYNRLKAAGYEPWMDKKDILGGEQWELAIKRAIKNTDFCIVALSNNLVRKRGYIQAEIRLQVEQLKRKLEEDVFVIPLRLEKCEAPENLEHLHYIDYFEPNGWNKLTHTLSGAIRRLSK